MASFRPVERMNSQLCKEGFNIGKTVVSTCRQAQLTSHYYITINSDYSYVLSFTGYILRDNDITQRKTAVHHVRIRVVSVTLAAAVLGWDFICCVVSSCYSLL